MKQRVTLYGQISSWAITAARVTQGSVLGSGLFLIYINDLPDGLPSIVNLFADDASFPVVHDVSASAKELNKDLNKTNSWAFQWKINFNLDLSKQSQELLLSRKLQKVPHPKLFF